MEFNIFGSILKKKIECIMNPKKKKIQIIFLLVQSIKSYIKLDNVLNKKLNIFYN